MIRQSFDIEHYWRVIVYYQLDYGLFSIVEREMLDIGAPKWQIEELYDTMSLGEAKAVTCNIAKKHTSVILFNVHNSKTDFINSVIHEAEHVKQAMLKAYYVEDKGEPPSYTMGYLVSKMWGVFRQFVCDACE